MFRFILTVTISLLFLVFIGCGEEESRIIPGLPSKIQGTLGNRQIILSWEPAENAVAYKILRSDKAEGVYTEIGTITGTNFVDTKVSHNTSYYYKIISVSKDGMQNDEVMPYLFTYKDEPKLWVSVETLDFGELRSELEISKTIEISNIGTGILSWKAKCDKDWISVEPKEGTVTTDKSAVVIKVKRNDLPPDSYTATITISSPEGGNKEILAKMVVPEIPAIWISQTEVDFGITNDVVTVEIKNLGTGVLSWQASREVEWFSVEPISGKTGQEVDKLTLKANRSGLAPNIYVATLTLTSNGGDRKIIVKMEVPPKPSLNVDKKSLAFDETTEILPLKVSNTGTGVLKWSISKLSHDWITVQPVEGEARKGDGGDLLTVKVKSEGLSPGQHTGSINITSNGGNEEISVTVTISPKPKLSISTQTMDFKKEDEVLTLIVKNIGTGTLIWSISTSQDWIIVEPVKGETREGSENTLKVKVKSEGLSPGQHTGSINITSNGGNDAISVTVPISPKPKLSIKPQKLYFGEKDKELTLTVENIGTGDLKWKVETDAKWISIRPTEGNTSTKPSEITVQVDREGLSPNAYISEIRVTSNDGNQNIAVQMVVPEPLISVSPSILNFGDSEKILQIEISNVGKGKLNWQIKSHPIWLSFKPSSGSISEGEKSIVTVEVRRESLDMGEYLETIPIISNATNSAVIQLHLKELGIIEGRVKDGITGSPLAQADILLNDKVQTTTDRDGLFSFSIQSDGTYNIRVSKEGYIGKLRQVTTLNGTAPLVEIVLKPIPRVVKTIKDNAIPFRTPTQLALSPDQTRLFVTNPFDNTVSVIDTFTNQIRGKIPIGIEPTAIKANPNPVINEIYVANSMSNDISIIDVAQNKEVSRIQVGKSPVDLVVSPDGKTLFVVNKGDETISIISIEGRKQIGAIRTRKDPEGVTITPDGIYLYLSHFGEGVVSVIDFRSRNEIDVIPVGREPTNIVANSTGKYVYVINSGDDTISIIDVSSRIALPPVETVPGGGASGLAIITADDNSDLVFITHSFTSEIALIEIPPDISQIQRADDTIPVGSSPKGIVVLEKKWKIYVANSEDDSISVLEFK